MSTLGVNGKIDRCFIGIDSYLSICAILVFLLVPVQWLKRSSLLSLIATFMRINLMTP